MRKSTIDRGAHPYSLLSCFSKYLIFVIIVVIIVASFLAKAYSVSESFWVYGTIATTPAIVSYNNLNYSQFNLTVANSSAVWILSSLPLNLTVLIPTSFLVDIALIVGQTLNVTGVVDVVGVPSGCFVVDQIEGQSASPEWLESLKLLVSAFSIIGKLIVGLIVSGVQAATGVELPAWVPAVILIMFTGFSIFKWFKVLPKVLLVIFIVIVVGLACSFYV